jgi:hypothetical protein
MRPRTLLLLSVAAAAVALSPLLGIWWAIRQLDRDARAKAQQWAVQR